MFNQTDGAEPFRKVSIYGLYGVGNFELDFNNQFVINNRDQWDIGSDLDNLRIIYGLNGSGKTTVLRIIKMLLEGDIPGLLTIPFESIEIERWESYDPPITHKIPHFPDGFQIWGGDYDPSFSECYNHLKILTKEFHDDWPDNSNTAKDAGFIDNGQQEKLDAFLKLQKNASLLDKIEGISEPGSYELGLCNEHIHRFRITKVSEVNNLIKAEYIQDRNHRRNDNDYNFEPLFNLFNIDQESITSIVGKEVIASAELSEVTSIERYISFLNKEIKIEINEAAHEEYEGIGYLSMLSRSQITELNDKGIIDISSLKNVWMAYHGYRKFWSDKSSIKKFEENFSDNNTRPYTIPWDNNYSNPENPLVSIIPYHQEFSEISNQDLEHLSEPSVWTSAFLDREELQDEMKWLDNFSLLENFTKSTDRSMEESLVAFVRGCIFIEDFILNYCTEDLGKKLSFHNKSRSKINDLFLSGSPDVIRVIQNAENGFDAIKMGHICFPFLKIINDDFLENKRLVITSSWKTVIVSRGLQIPFNKISHGESRLLQILWVIGQDTYSLINPSKFRRWKTVIIDEPEVGLHIDWQRKLTSAIKGFYDSESNFMQIDPVNVILCTHSPEIVASAPEDSISIQPVNLEE